VGRHIFDKVIGPNGLLQTKARIFVTHSIQFLPETNTVFMLNEGKMAVMGQYKELIKDTSGPLFTLMKEYGKRKEEASREELVVPDASDICSQHPGSVATKTITPSTSKDKLNEKPGKSSTPAVPLSSQRGTKLMTTEESAKGSVSWAVYAAYARSCGIPGVLGYLLVAVFSQGLSIAQNFYLADWANDNDADKQMNVFAKVSIFVGGFHFSFLSYVIFLDLV
jgi:ATP-binding cassette, subfamily C (CFTR/MRP), member 1